jgi:hypothetical protein
MISGQHHTNSEFDAMRNKRLNEQEELSWKNRELFEIDSEDFSDLIAGIKVRINSSGGGGESPPLVRSGAPRQLGGSDRRLDRRVWKKRTVRELALFFESSRGACVIARGCCCCE